MKTHFGDVLFFYHYDAAINEWICSRLGIHRDIRSQLFAASFRLFRHVHYAIHDFLLFFRLSLSVFVKVDLCELRLNDRLLTFRLLSNDRIPLSRAYKHGPMQRRHRTARCPGSCSYLCLRAHGRRRGRMIGFLIGVLENDEVLLLLIDTWSIGVDEGNGCVGST